MGIPTGTISTIREDIRTTGLRATPARVATLKLLREATSPLTHADVADQLDRNGIDRATAFRNLNDLTDAGLLRRTELGDHVYRFEEIRPDEKENGAHPHFLCTICGAVSCLTNVELTPESLRECMKIGDVFEILLRGRCNECK